MGAIAVVLGAFGAHYLKQHISDYAVNIFETGIRYQFYHVFALLAVGILYKDFSNKCVRWSGMFFIAGIILFSGSLYCLMLIKGFVIPGYNFIGAITPIGGVAFIAGWMLLFIGLLKPNKIITQKL